MHWLVLYTEPVALIGWSLLALSWFLFRQRPRRGVFVAALSISFLFFAVATPIGANLAVGMLEQPVKQGQECKPSAAGNVIVVLAGGMSGVPATATEYSRLQEPSLRRTLEGVRLAQQSANSRLLLAGGSGGEVREADLMAALVQALGFPAGRLLLERESRDTFESARNVREIVKPIQAGTLYLVTSALHMPRAIAVFRRQELEVCGFPVDHSWVDPELHAMLIPQISALRKGTAAYHEIVGYTWYWLSGRL